MPFFVKKSLTNGERDGIIPELSARAAKICWKQGKFERIWKKFLTNWTCWGIIKQLRDEKLWLGTQRHSSKNFEKNRKKFLTSSKRCDKLKKFIASQKLGSANTSVPCKLNNVKTIFNTLDNYGLFKRKRKNSQRKFLSNIARSKLFKKWF